MKAATVGVIVALLVWAGSAGVRPAAAADSPTVTPATGGGGVPIIFGHFDDVDAIGYQTTEYILSGNAHSYSTAAPLTEDGKWTAITPDPTTAPYTTRVIVHMPKKPGKFKGTVYVEWFNVTGLADASPDWVHGHLQIAREGAAYVGVSAQAAGIDQLLHGISIPADYPGDPVRYASLVHPGDSYSYDIFSQAGQAVRDGALLGAVASKKLKRVIAIGESQSAGRLVTYIDAVQPLAQIYDGFVVHSRFGGGAQLSQAPLTNVSTPVPTLIRDDGVPVLVFESEYDIASSMLQERQTETPDGNFRQWEVAGTAHYDVYGLIIGLTDIGDGQGEIDNLATLQDPPSIPQPGLIECAEPINAGPMHWVFNAAVYWIERWLKKGTPPPIAPRLEATSAPGDPVVFSVDQYGNTLGGIRTPYVDVPLGKLVGTGNTGAPGAPPTSTFCSLFGQTVPFTSDEVAALYPDHKAYTKAFNRATASAKRSKFLLGKDASLLKKAAKKSDVAN
jgi:Alpha/beta hydrolase domain